MLFSFIKFDTYMEPSSPAGYLDYVFHDSPESINAFDELPLWSAPFGLLLLKHLELKKGITVLDIGSGTGFPLLELASRLGNTSRIYGVDPLKNANDRVREKVAMYSLQNVTLFDQEAENIPLKNASVDLIVSNLGINNFKDPDLVLRECLRLLKQGGKLAITTNTNGHWKEIYEAFYTSLKECGKPEYIDVLKNEQAYRGTFESINNKLESNCFRVTNHAEENFEMKFADGTAFFNHHFIKLGWVGGWLKLFKKKDLEIVFRQLENNLNHLAREKGELKLTVPMLFVEATKK